MKIAICGKGGVGKTTLSGILCRLLGRSGRRVLAIDGDPNPNLSVVLGIAPGGHTPPPLSTDILERVEEEGKRYIKLGVPLSQVITEYGVSTPDNVTLLSVGQPAEAGSGCMCGSHTAVREVIHAAMESSKEITILDMEASMEHMKRGTSRYVDMMLTVVEPYYRSLEAAGRFHRLATELGIKKVMAVANKVRNEEEEAAIRQYCEKVGMPVAMIIPYDEKIARADREGKSIVDYDLQAPAVQRVGTLIEQMNLN